MSVPTDANPMWPRGTAFRACRRCPRSTPHLECEVCGSATVAIRAFNLDRYAAPSLRFGMTPRESSVMDLIAEGRTYRDAAEHLGISPHTVKATLVNARVKMGASNVREAIAIWSAAR